MRPRIRPPCCGSSSSRIGSKNRSSACRRSEPMDRWTRLEHVYHGARELSGDSRGQFLDEQCGSDHDLRRQVEELLAQDAAPDSFFNRPAVDVAAVWPTMPPALKLTGRRVGPYEVLDAIGSGGMGEVYRARDTKLQRDVALKVLPPPLRSDPDRLSRFAREARSLAALNHPNIAAIYGFEEADDVQALALELVEGPTLADRIGAGPLPLDEVLSIARQIVAALDAAHGQGIVHRDLKPANIKVRSDGMVKVLDFGLAKAVAPDVLGSGDAVTSPTMTSPALTRMGVLLGTAAYMSPEQAKGRPVDTRTDVWAFGCVLYEMLTGKRAFAGEDVSDTLAVVLRGEPDWTALPTKLPSPIRTLLAGCLTKDRKACIADVSAVRFLMSERGNTAPALDRPATQPPWKRAVLVSAMAFVGAVAVGIVAWSLKPSRAIALPVVRFSLPLLGDRMFTNGGRQLLAISPDGTRVVYVADRRLYL